MLSANLQQHIESVPAFYATNSLGQKQPFIVSLMFLDQQQKARLTPAVELSINKTVEITGLECLASATIGIENESEEKLDEKIKLLMNKAFRLERTIVLFLCATPHLCELTMQTLNHIYKLSLIRCV